MSLTRQGALRLAALALLLLAALLLSVRLGAVPLGVGEILGALRGQGDAATVSIVRELRLPRALLAALVGAALAVSGATFQALLRNPLAEPYILGVSGGAAVGAVAATVLGWAAVAGWAVPVAAFAGALLAVALVYRIALSVGRVLDTRVLLLSGVVVGAFFNACILLALVFTDTESFRAALFWMMGSLAGASWRGTALLALYALPALLVLLALARPLNLLALGEDTAAYLGVRVERIKLLAFVTASLLTAAAVAVSGVVGFVGLVVPHVVRLLWGSNHRFLLPASMLLGGAFLALADTAARVVAAPAELPIGVVTAFIGVPFFVWLLRRPPAAARGEARSAAEPAVGGGSTLAPLPAGDGRPDGAAWRCRELAYGYPDAARPALDGATLEVPAGRCTAVLGPNGSGKSTLLRALLGVLPAAGRVELQGRPLGEWSRAELARVVGVLPQGEEEVFPLRVRELVAMGRYPHLGPWRREREVDGAAIAWAMQRCEVAHLADRLVGTLSGGERQRVRLARALAQEPTILALDEPTTALDVRHEMAIFELLRELTRCGVTTLLVTHNLNLAARYADRLVLLAGGRVAAAGTPAEVITRERIERVYGWPVAVVAHPGPGADAGAPQVVPLAGGAAPDLQGRQPSPIRHIRSNGR